jgi:hypothetical protein
MSRLSLTIALVISLCQAFLSFPTAVQAIPQLPSSFYGTILVNNANVPDGTPVEAVIAGQVVISGSTQTYQGNSVYSLDIPSDLTETPAIDGGKEGDTIQFKVGGLLATQTGTWHSGTNMELNLTVSTAATPLPPQPTTTQPPSQTSVSVLQPSTTLTATPINPSTTALIPTSLATLTPPANIITASVTAEILPSMAVTPLSISPTTSTIPTSDLETNNPSRRKAQNLAVGILLLAAIVVLVVFVRRRILQRK